MPILATITGSYPPISSDQTEISIEFAVKSQIEAGIDVLVDGQVRSDLLSIFAGHLGLEGRTFPYHFEKILVPQQSITLHDLQIASQTAGGLPLKAHLAGPTILAQSCLVSEAASSRYAGTMGFRRLTLDIARSLSKEARFLATEGQHLNISYLQIDEPSLIFGADIALATEALEIISTAWKVSGGKQVILHVCGDYGSIFSELLKMPADILSVEIEHLRELSEEQINLLRSSAKKLALGVIPVNTNYVPSPARIAQEVLYVGSRCGTDLIWGITPVCGMRLSSPELAYARMVALVQATKLLTEEV